MPAPLLQPHHRQNRPAVHMMRLCALAHAHRLSVGIKLDPVGMTIWVDCRNRPVVRERVKHGGLEGAARVAGERLERIVGGER